MNKLLFVLGSVLLCFNLAGCSTAMPPGDYDVSEIGKVKQVASGMIISKRPVIFHNQLPTSKKSNKAPGSGYLDKGTGYEYGIKLNNGEIISVVQAEDLKLEIEQQVLVIYGKHTRILPKKV